MVTDRAVSASSNVPPWRWLVFAIVLLGFILVPFALLGPTLDVEALDALHAATGTVGMGLLVASLLAVDVLLPVPSSIVSTLSGVLLGFPLGMTASFVGMTLGCVVGYVLGRFGGQRVTARLVGAGATEQLASLTERYGEWTLPMCRAVPILAEASVIIAGIGKMRPVRFLLVSSLSNLGISATYGAVGALAADSQSFLIAFGAALALPFLALRAARGPLRRTS